MGQTTEQHVVLQSGPVSVIVYSDYTETDAFPLPGRCVYHNRIY
jgi:hypothetical protein